MRIELTVPGLLQPTIGGVRTTHLDASTLDEALDVMRKKFPLLVPHVYDDTGHIRRHVMVYYNDESVMWIKDKNIPLKEGDRIQVIQAISGG